MNSLKNTDAGEINNGINAEQIPSDLETELRLKLEKTKEFRGKFQKLQDKLSENKNPEEEEQIRKEMKELFDLQIATDDLYSFFDFATKYQEYMSDVLEKYQNYRSELIADYNFLYALGLYRKYAKDAYEEFSEEFRKYGRHSHILKYLLSISKFERCLYYHAYSLCVNQGIESPDYDDVNKMISTKPYGDSSLYPQNEIWQIVGFPGDSDHNVYRDYYCGLVLRNRELTKKQSEDIANGSPVQANNFKSKTI
ncbi:MAG: hypothetical protein ABSF81_17650 [Bacteroidales bacterium]|jgi:hypothetical protein